MRPGRRRPPPEGGRSAPSAWAAAALLAASLSCADAPPAPVRWAQWVWSPADSATLAAARARLTDVQAGVWASTIAFEGRAVVQRLARSPRLAGADSVAAVVRIDDSMHDAWDALPDSALADALAARLAAALRAAEATGVRLTEVQLDYDCPTRRLERWAGVVRRLSGGALAGRTVWVTSIPTHVAVQGYGRHFRGAAAGHILQVFDTGDPYSPEAASRLDRQLARHELPFRLGVGVFERELAPGRLTDHRRWFEAVPRLARNPWFRGVWVFPAGRPWVQHIAPDLPEPRP